MFVELVLAELPGLAPMRWTAHSRQFARIVTEAACDVAFASSQLK